MKKRSIWIHLLAALCLTSPAFAGDICSHVTLDWIREQVPITGKPSDPLAEAKIISRQPQKDFCEAVIAVNDQLVPVYAGRESLVAGQMYSKGTAVTRDTMAGLKETTK